MSSEKFEGWFIVELMGHRKFAGRLTEVQIAGVGFLRLDAPGVASQYYRPDVVYCLTPTTEEIATAYALRNAPEPVTRFDLPALQPASRAEVAEVAEREDCPGEGCCHGARKWCDACGDVAHTCDNGDCDVH